MAKEIQDAAVSSRVNLYVPPKYATDTRREFDPSTETHHFGFTVKVVDPGCTLEVQIEERSGQVTRVTTTDNQEHDRIAIMTAISEAVVRMFKDFSL